MFLRNARINTTTILWEIEVVNNPIFTFLLFKPRGEAQKGLKGGCVNGLKILPASFSIWIFCLKMSEFCLADFKLEGITGRSEFIMAGNTSGPIAFREANIP